MIEGPRCRKPQGKLTWLVPIRSADGLRGPPARASPLSAECAQGSATVNREERNPAQVLRRYLCYRSRRTCSAGVLVYEGYSSEMASAASVIKMALKMSWCDKEILKGKQKK